MSKFDYERLAHERLAEAGFYEMTLADLPPAEIVTKTDSIADDPFRYAVYGDTKNAPNIFAKIIPYSTRLSDRSIDLRLRSEQMALGEDYAVVGIEVYNPKDLKIPLKKMASVASGSFDIFANRVLRVLGEVQPKNRDDQQIIMAGWSLGADVGIETVHKNMLNPSGGDFEINCLGAYEAVRMAKRGLIAVVGAFIASGETLYENILASNSPALLEARGIDLKDPKAEKKHMNRVTRTVVAYNARDPLGNLAISQGFTHDNSKQQLSAIASEIYGPHITLGRMEDTLMTPEDFFSGINLRNVHVARHPGDHMNADNLTKNAGYALETVRLRTV